MKQKKIFILIWAATSVCGLKAQTEPITATEKKPPVVSDLKLSGLLISQYQYIGQEDAESNSFNIRLGRLSLEGRLLDDFYWKAQVQFNGNISTVGQSPRVIDLFSEWQKYKFFRVKLGQFKRPFTFENPIHPIDQGFMSVSQNVLKLCGFSDRTGEHSSNGRDIGIQLQGDVLKNAAGRELVHYQIGVYNGQGINTKDVDQRKDIIGGIWVMPVKGLRLGVFGWTGSYARRGNYTLVDPSTHAPVLDAGGHPQIVKGLQTVEKQRYALSAEYVVNDFTFRSEYIHSTGYSFQTTYNTKDDLQKADINYAAGNKADGFYALAIAPIIKKKVHIKARYDLYRSRAEWGSAKTLYELGADYILTRNLKFSGEYVFVNDRSLAKPNYQMIDIEVALRF
jgi:hypothetical protein